MVRVLGRGLWSVDLGHTAFGGPLRPPKASPQAMHPYQGREPPFLHLEIGSAPALKLSPTAVAFGEGT